MQQKHKTKKKLQDEKVEKMYSIILFLLYYIMCGIDLNILHASYPKLADKNSCKSKLKIIFLITYNY